MGTDGLDSALDRIEQALVRLEDAVSMREAQAAELGDLKARHRKLKETVTQELRQLDLLLTNLPQ
ncbi:hypothetical protein [Novosphingobium cyanobacteriorum]|uniref:DUF904 domain-containing protein n=1 Tax=Novosphingobium cyanobacteriorum TaxID=3024215 RepID=A0ABT6CMB8_9SPHN|nr:hypothetical protein [Novosphingobium cyanobacteriorum]MDF8335065.1 hypothetical protein [Novosphingobium cyanobacteriorum]